MRYIQYTFVDDATKIPVSKEPAKRGPVHPEGISCVFHDFKSFSSGVPIFYGTSEDDFEIEGWMVEYNEEEFLDIYRQLISLDIQSKLDECLKNINNLKTLHTCLVDSGIESGYFKSDHIWSILNVKELDRALKDSSTKFLKLKTFQYQVECELNSLEDLKQAAIKLLEIKSFNMEN